MSRKETLLSAQQVFQARYHYRRLVTISHYAMAAEEGIGSVHLARLAARCIMVRNALGPAVNHAARVGSECAARTAIDGA